MEFLSPLRYPGGKAKVADFVQCLIKENALLDGTYVEPYVGGGSVALSLLFNEYVSDIHINDKDISIYAFWYSALNNVDALCKMIKDTPLNVETWFKQKEIQSNKENSDLLELGFSTFFLNRTNRSGILNVEEREIGVEIDNRIHLTNEDAVSLVQRLKNELPYNTLFYLDPPYYVKGKGLYLNYYNDTDHQNIANTISEIANCKWIVSYDNVPFITSLYSKYRQQCFELNYSASNSGKGKEIMVFCDGIVIPKHKLFNHSTK